FFLAVLAGYHIPTAAGEGFAAGSPSFARPWVIPLVVVLGALGAGFLVFTWAPEAEGHGTDAAIDAVHFNPRGIKLRAVVIKIVASALTIGSGGSGGREGPTAQISAGFGSLLARVLDLSPEDGRIAVSVGIGSGIGAIFGAPLGGAVLAADVVYKEDFEYTALVPGVFASIIAYAIFGAVFGYRPLFATPQYHFNDPMQLFWFGVIGLLAGGMGLLYSKSFYGVVRLSHRLPFSRKLRPAVGGLLVGLMALALPEVLGTGYGWVQKALSDDLLHTSVWIFVLLPLARIAATALSIGTGGSGGVFGPGMVIGAFTGLAVWRVFEPVAPSVGHHPAPYVIVGMMAVFGGISRAPLAVMIMVAEMTGNIEIVAPAMVAIALATFIVSRADDSIYRSQLRSRADSEASRFQFGMPLLALLHVDAVCKRPRLVLHAGTSGAEALEQLHEASVTGAPVVDDDDLYLGTVDTDRLTRAVRTNSTAAVTSVLDETTTTVPATTRLNQALESLVQAGGRWVTVTGASRKVVGILAISDVVSGYRQALLDNAGQISQVSSKAVTIEERVGKDSPLVGEALRDSNLPPGSIVISLQRGEHMIFATGSTTLEVGDMVSALTNSTTAEATRRMIRGTDEPEPPVVARGGQMV
ncbi:MAG: chloride channel protein, partial [Acidimicrobiales bacterium]